jgi:16S rRNA processing protein RimM
MTAGRGSRDEDGVPGWVCVGRIAGAHGIKGEVMIESFTQRPETLAGLQGLALGAGGAPLRIVAARPHKRGLIARLDGVADRSAAETHKGVRLFVPRAALGQAREGIFHADLIGMAVADSTGAPLGMVAGVANYGGGDLLEIALSAGGTALVPFTRQAVPVVDEKARKGTVDPAFIA